MCTTENSEYYLYCKQISMDNLLLEPIQYSEIEEVATLLACVFRTNPAYSAIFRKKDQLDKGLLWLFRASLLIDNQKQLLTRVIREKDSKKIIGTFTLIPPEGIDKNISIYTKVGIGSFISKFGINTFYRMLKLNSINKKLLSEALSNTPHFYLSMVAIKEEYRGRGIGSFFLRQSIDKLMATNPNYYPIGLTTQLSENVIFYSRLGFSKLDEGYITFKESKYYNYNMKYDPSSTIHNQ